MSIVFGGSEASSAHFKSGEVELSALDLFTVPPTNITYNGYRIVEINPTSENERKNHGRKNYSIVWFTSCRSHWLGIFTKKDTCEVFDSYGLPLNWYKPSDVVEWVFENFETVSSNAMTLQEMNSQSCGQYALMYLKAKVRGQSIDDFRSLFKKGDFVHNDHLVGEVIKPLLNSRVKNLKCCKQDNGRSCPLDI